MGLLIDIGVLSAKILFEGSLFVVKNTSNAIVTISDALEDELDAMEKQKMKDAQKQRILQIKKLKQSKKYKGLYNILDNEKRR